VSLKHPMQQGVYFVLDSYEMGENNTRSQGPQREAGTDGAG